MSISCPLGERVEAGSKNTVVRITAIHTGSFFQVEGREVTKEVKETKPEIAAAKEMGRCICNNFLGHPWASLSYFLIPGGKQVSEVLKMMARGKTFSNHLTQCAHYHRP